MSYRPARLGSLESVIGLLKSLKIRALAGGTAFLRLSMVRKLHLYIKLFYSFFVKECVVLARKLKLAGHMLLLVRKVQDQLE